MKYNQPIGSSSVYMYIMTMLRRNQLNTLYYGNRHIHEAMSVPRLLSYVSIVICLPNLVDSMSGNRVHSIVSLVECRESHPFRSLDLHEHNT